MDDSIVHRIVAAPADIEFAFEEVPATYFDASKRVDGSLSVRVTLDQIRAELRASYNRLTTIAVRGPGEVSTDDFLLRDYSAGTLLEESAYARIVPEDANWEIARATNDGCQGSLVRGDDRTVYRFAVQKLHKRGPAFGSKMAAVRRLFAGSELSSETTFANKSMILRPMMNKASSPTDEVLSVTTIGTLDEIQEHALWSALSFISGNRLNPLTVETFDDDGGLIESRHERGAGVSHGRNAPFYQFQGRITPTGIEQIGNGFVRLLRADFPIANVVHQLTEANTNNGDIDGQHLTLAIHAAIEAWNRMFGMNEWIDEETWKKWFRVLHKNLLRPVLRPTYDDIGVNVISNIRSAVRHANRTTTAWRQKQMLDALQIDVSDEDSKRVLNMRDELLHNGFFLTRFQDLTRKEQQQRIDDLARLRNLAHTVVFRLAGFTGQCFDFLTYQARNVDPVPLPVRIANQPLDVQ